MKDWRKTKGKEERRKRMDKNGKKLQTFPPGNEPKTFSAETWLGHFNLSLCAAFHPGTYQVTNGLFSSTGKLAMHEQMIYR